MYTYEIRNGHKDLEIDPVLDPLHVDQWLISEASPKQKKEFVNVYDRYICAC